MVMHAGQFVAHRGYRCNYPENTLLAHQMAVDAGALFVETDIQMTGDGIPVLYHDIDMLRLSGLQQRLDEFTAEQLKQVTVCEPQRFGHRFEREPVATLDDFVVWLAERTDVTAYIEIKPECRQGYGLNAVAQILNRLRPVFSQVVIISFDIDSIGLARHLGAPRVGVVLSTWQTWQMPMMAQIQPDVFFCDAYLIPDNVDLSAYKTPFVIYEVSDLAQAEYWLSRGADQVETYNIGTMLETLAKR
nr:glycerophosphodiester phosphodiesterase family protein [uncultured Desulfuromonas sp.]